MKKQDDTGKELIAGKPKDDESQIKEVIYGNGVTMKETIDNRKADKAKRLDESR